MQQLTGRCWSWVGFILAIMAPGLMFLVLPVMAVADCGTVVGSSGEEEAITDCANPLGQATGWPHSLRIEGDVVLADTTVAVAPDTIIALTLDAADQLIDGYFEPALYRHTASGYEYIDLYPQVVVFETSESIIRTFASDYFPAAVDNEPFVQALLSEDAFFAAGNDLSEEQRQTLYDFYDALVSSLEANLRPRWESGTYTVVAEEVCLFLSHQTPKWWERFMQFVTPVAYAASPRPCAPSTDWHTITFTVTTEPITPPAPPGASSVLFLPGIQASRLYAGTDITVPGAFNDITQNERVWEPGNNNDVEVLRMTPNGDSEQVIYTNDILTAASVDIGLGLAVQAGDFYTGISRTFDELVATGLIAEWQPYAYDWRYDVATVVADGVLTDAVGTRRDIVSVLSQLATESFSGQVTIVAHSNGGLLAKAVLQELSARDLTHLVDTVVFIATPQEGTPKAIGTMLHAYDQELGQGWVVDAGRARAIIGNLPGAYGLLPTAEYLAEAPASVISFDSQPATRDYRERFGQSITTIADFNTFLLAGGSAASTTLPLYEPVQVNAVLLDGAQALHASQLATWKAPAGMRVVEIVGIGLPTPVGIQYTDTGQFVCESSFFGGTTECVRAKPRPVALLSVFGDQTVMAQSAAAYDQEKETYYVDLLSLSRNDEDRRFNHANLTEAPAIQGLVTQLIATTTVPVLPDHIFSTKPVNTEQVYTVEVIASPVAVATTDAAGRTTGAVPTTTGWEVRREIPGSHYFTLGGVQHLVVPETAKPRTTTIAGLAEGTFSYLVYRVTGQQQVLEHTITNATATTALRGEITVVDGVFGSMIYDYDGDGEVDATETLTGDYVVIATTTGKLVEPGVEEEATPGATSVRFATGTRTARPLVLGVSASSTLLEPTLAQWQQLYQALVQLSAVLAQWQETVR